LQLVGKAAAIGPALCLIDDATAIRQALRLLLVSVGLL
jgi:hypothetical protein